MNEKTLLSLDEGPFLSLNRRTFLSLCFAALLSAIMFGKPSAEAVDYFNRYNGIRELTRKNYDFVIVNGFGPATNSILPDVAIKRVDDGIELYKNNKADKILFTEGKVDNMGISGARFMRQYAIEKSVLPSDIVIEEKATTTAANAYYTKIDYLNPLNKKNNIIVTSGVHMPRAKYAYDIYLGNKFLTDGFSENSGLYNDVFREQIFLGGYSFLSSFPLPIADGDHETLRDRFEFADRFSPFQLF